MGIIKFYPILKNRSIGVFFILFFMHCFLYAQHPVINEIMAANASTITDRDGDYPDWIEIYNPGEEAINLTGYALSDDLTEPFKWIFPSTILQAGEFKLIFASDKNYRTEESCLHTNFKISSDGETLVLSDSSGVIIDQVESVQLESDQSWGRQPDGSATWYFFDQPTPGSANSSSGSAGTSPDVEFSQTGGFYTDQLTVTINCESSDAKIYYTTDCSEPDENSQLYSGSILINETTVLRARSYLGALSGGNIATQTYLINEDITLPVVSLATEASNLYGSTGIYTNYLEDWERPVHFEFYETDGSQQANLNAGIKIGGSHTRARPQKSFKIYCRSEYGASSIHYQVFPDLPIYEFNRLYLRNSGNDWDQTHFRDAFCQRLVSDLELETQAYRPAVVFLNGGYWGILNLRERQTEDYLVSHYGVDPDAIDLIELEYPNETFSVIEGSLDRFNSLYDYIESHDFSQDEPYVYVQSKLDMDSFIDFLITGIYFNNTDWPNNNIKLWHPGTTDGKFRFMLFDLDWSSGYQSIRVGTEDENTYKANTLTWALQEDMLHISFMFRSFLQNQAFKTEFINRFADYLNTVFLPEHAQSVIDAIKTPLEAEMPRHYEKFKNIDTPKWYHPISDWYVYIDTLETFMNKRPPYIRQHIMDYFDLSDSVPLNLQINPANSGSIALNHIRINDATWQGEYFTDVPVTLIAAPNIGYRFTGWSGDVDSDSLTIYQILSGEQTLIANFERDESACQVVINEINYHASDDFDPGDWIELYNASDSETELSGWILKDENSTTGFSIPDNTVMEADGYLVLCSSAGKFHQLFPQISNYMGDLGFAFDNGGERICLYNAQNALMDSVLYDDSDPWPVQPDGNGPTLMLKDPNYDNSLAQNWKSSTDHGTPGASNQSTTGIEDEEAVEIPSDFSMDQNYPNPFNSVTQISYTLPKTGSVVLTIYDIRGTEVARVIHPYQQAGRYVIQFDASGLSSGLYVYRLQVDQRILGTKKMLLIN